MTPLAGPTALTRPHYIVEDGEALLEAVRHLSVLTVPDLLNAALGKLDDDCIAAALDDACAALARAGAALR